jgi:hypothetical protein
MYIEVAAVGRTLGFILHKSDADLDEPENWSQPDGPDFGVQRAQKFYIYPIYEV